MARFSSIGNTTSLGIVPGRRVRVQIPSYYPLTNTATDPTSANWRNNYAPAGYTFVPNDGIYTDEPITNMREMFSSDGSLQFNDPDISTWDVSTVTNMLSMFFSLQTLTQSLNSWNVSNVTNMSRMFGFTFNYNLPLDNWDVSNVTNMSGMFDSTGFNQDISMWDVSSVTDMGAMFGFSPFNQPIGSWDVSNVTNMDNMFIGNNSFAQDLSSWCVTNITAEPIDFNNTNGVNPVWGTCPDSGFYYPLTNTATDPTTPTWRNDHAPAGYTFVPNDGIYTDESITTMQTMFDSSTINDPDIVLWDVSTVTNMNSAFALALDFNQPIGSWDVSNVTSMNQMFLGASSFNQSLALWDVSNVTSMDQMFSNASLFNQDLSNWCVTNISATPFMFISGSGYNFDDPNWELNMPVWGTCPTTVTWYDGVDWQGGGTSTWSDNATFSSGNKLKLVTLSDNAMAAALRLAGPGDTFEIEAYVTSTQFYTLTLTGTFTETDLGSGFLQFVATVAETSTGWAQLISSITYTAAPPSGQPTIGQFVATQGGYYAGRIDYSGGSGTAVYDLYLAPKDTETTLGYGLADGITTSSVDGLANTQALNTANYPAAEYAVGLTTGGYSDWYIPAYYEMQMLMYNFKPATNDNVVGTSNSDYGAYGVNPYAVPTTEAYTLIVPAQITAAAFQEFGEQAMVTTSNNGYWTSTQRGGIFTMQNWTGLFNTYGEHGYFGSAFKQPDQGSKGLRCIRRVAVS